MSWLERLLRRPSRDLDPALAAQRARYLAAPAVDTASPMTALRLVIADVETSGLDPFHDRLIAIGAVGFRAGQIRLDEAFHVVLRQDRISAHGNILVHGIDGTTQLSGRVAAEALIDFLDYTGRAPLVGFHADFDRTVIERAMKAALGIKPANPWLDLAFLAPALFPEPAKRARNLDDWLAVFDIENYARHDAVADSVATGQLLQVCLAEASRKGLARCADLMRLEADQRWLSRH